MLDAFFAWMLCFWDREAQKQRRNTTVWLYRKRVQYGTNKKGNVLWNIAFSSGASCLTRTGDTLINSQVL